MSPPLTAVCHRSIDLAIYHSKPIIHALKVVKLLYNRVELIPEWEDGLVDCGDCCEFYDAALVLLNDDGTAM